MLNIAYVLPHFPALSETYVSTEIRAMKKLGHKIVPIAFERQLGKYQLCDEDLKQTTRYLCDMSSLSTFKVLPYLRYSLPQAITFAFQQRGLAVKSLLMNALKLAYLARRMGCTHFHAHFAHDCAATAIVAAKLCGATVSFVGHGEDVYVAPKDLALKLNTVDFAVAVCEDMSRQFQRLAPKANVKLIYRGVDIERFRRIKATHATLVTTDVGEQMNSIRLGKLLFVGSLNETKGLPTLLQALASIPHYHRPKLDIVGDGKLKNELASLVRDFQLSQHVNFLGAKQSSWLILNAHQYAAAVFPFEKAENGNRDAGPVVVKEAMALRLPVITTYFMGCHEMLTNSCAIRVSSNNPVALSTAITQFFRMSQDEVTHMIDKAYFRVISLYSAELQANYLSNVIERRMH